MKTRKGKLRATCAAARACKPTHSAPCRNGSEKHSREGLMDVNLVERIDRLLISATSHQRCPPAGCNCRVMDQSCPSRKTKLPTGGIQYRTETWFGIKHDEPERL